MDALRLLNVYAEDRANPPIMDTLDFLRTENENLRRQLCELEALQKATQNELRETRGDLALLQVEMGDEEEDEDVGYEMVETVDSDTLP